MVVSAVEFEGVEKGYKAGDVRVPVLKGVDLEVEEGELLVVLGPSGSGKTTLLNLAAGIDTPDKGTVRVAGRDLAGLTDDELTAFRREKVGYIFQFFNLLPTLTALENVAVALELLDRPDDVAAAAALKGVGLGDKGERFPHQLSGGEQQRVAIARAIVKSPDLVVADEPTGNLDEEIGKDVIRTLAKAREEAGATVILATHDARAREVADRVMRIGDGVLRVV